MICTKNVCIAFQYQSAICHMYCTFLLIDYIQFIPIGPVWYNFPTQQSSNINNNANNSPPILKRGIVDSVSLDFVTRDMIYNIIYKDDTNNGANTIIIDEVAEKELYYGSSCPVTIAAEEDDGNGNSSSDEGQEGTVLYCEQSSKDPSKIVYTVMIYNEGTSQARYVENIQAESVKYRNIQVVPTNTEAEEEEEGGEVQKQDVVDNQKKTVAAVPLSITCESTASHPNKKMKHSPLHSVGGGSSSKHSGGGSTRGSDHDGSGRMKSVSIANHDDGEKDTERGTRIDIRVPIWLQRDGSMQQDLFCKYPSTFCAVLFHRSACSSSILMHNAAIFLYTVHLIGRKHERARSVSDIGRETNCRIRVNYKPPNSNHLYKDPVTDYITITVHANSHQFRYRDLGDARCKIQHLLLDYVGGDGSRGRLVYECALSCWGSHRPKTSTSKAVKVSDPFNSGTGRFMTVLPLPCQLHTGGNKKVYHAANLLISEVQRRITYEANSYIKLVGDEFKVPCKLCEPYVLVMGSSSQGVDKGADIVKEVVKKHMDTCSCTFS